MLVCEKIYLETYINNSGGSRISQMGAPTPKVGAPNFSRNCMKMKEIDPRMRVPDAQTGLLLKLFLLVEFAFLVVKLAVFHLEQ